MGNPEFNGKKFDYWSDTAITETKDESYPIYGVWNNDMKARQYISEWLGTVAPDKQTAINKAKRLNLKIDMETEQLYVYKNAKITENNGVFTLVMTGEQFNSLDLVKQAIDLIRP